MNQKSLQIIFPILLSITLFSYWAAFALLIVNKFFHKDLPGYTIGRICIWEVIALAIAALIAKLMIHQWGNINIQQIDQQTKLTMHPNYGIYFALYFLIAIILGIWQFWLFSQKFP